MTDDPQNTPAAVVPVDYDPSQPTIRPVEAPKPAVVTDPTDPDYDPKKIYKKVDWTPEDIVGSGEFQDIYYRPDGVPEDYPEEWLPGIRFKKVLAEDLKRFQRIHSGKPGESGDPERAEDFLLRKSFVEFMNLNVDGDWYDFLTKDTMGKKIKAFAMTEFIIREVPSTVQGKRSQQRYRRS